MVGDVAGQDVSQRAYSERVVAGDASALPGLCGQVAEEGQRSQTKDAELFYMAGPGNFVGPGSRNADFLIEAGQRERVGFTAQGHTSFMPLPRHRERLLVACRIAWIQGVEFVEENIGKHVIPK